MHRIIRGRWTAAAVAALAIVAASAGRVAAQEGQGKYVTEAAARLVKLIDKSNGEGYKLQDNSFSIGGGWLKQGENNWVPLFTVVLDKGRAYRFLASGDVDAKDVDLQILDPNGKEVAADTGTNAEAVVNYTPQVEGRYLVRIRLYASDKNLPCVCLGVVTAK